MTMGLMGPPSTFQSLMDRILNGLQGVEMFVYMDDIVLYASSLLEHTNQMKKLLGRLKTAGLTLQPTKCLFLRNEVEYLGHIIFEKGVQPDPSKTLAVAQFPQPRNRKTIKQLLGLAGYYRKFIPGFSEITKPLRSFLKKDTRFIWGEAQNKAFSEIRIFYAINHFYNFRILTSGFWSLQIHRIPPWAQF